jgi:hypothetical protein
VKEEIILSQIRMLLEINNAVVFRSIERVPKCHHCGQWLGFSESGIPDLWGWMKPEESTTLPFWIEVKSTTGRLRAAQERFIMKAKADGLLAFTAKSWDDVKREFLKFGVWLKGS